MRNVMCGVTVFRGKLVHRFTNFNENQNELKTNECHPTHAYAQPSHPQQRRLSTGLFEKKTRAVSLGEDYE
jgi:hypothetical protein